MFILKRYQKKTLNVLSHFLELARILGPQEAFSRTIQEYSSAAIAQNYRIRWELDNVPYVCLRLPTGAGKTFLSSYSVGIAARKYLEKDFPLVLWLVPSTTILNQTVEALKNPSHPCRKALDNDFGVDGVAIFSISDVNNIRPQDLTNKTCIVVATVQTLRVADSNKEKRKVYGHNENFEPHFKALRNNAVGLDRDAATGQVLFSFVNILHQLRPLVIVDEAHKAVSQLSGEMMQRINPACVLEYTATPVESNVLYRVLASALKQEEMVKLPFMLTEHTSWQQAISGAKHTLAMLNKKASDDPDYIRPIVLLQAQKKGQSVPADVLKQHLIDIEGINESEIAVVTGQQRELDSIDLFDKTCPIRYIITVEALKEGWDCSFAYILCSVSNIKSAVDVEQLLGRVMRMPYAKKRSQRELNNAYAHVIAPSFQSAADEMHEKLIDMGFGIDEAAENIHRTQVNTLPGINHSELPLFTASKPLEITTKKIPKLDALTDTDRSKITVQEGSSGHKIIKVTGAISKEIEDVIVATLPKKEKDTMRRKIAMHRITTATSSKTYPAENGIRFVMPRLCAEVEGFLEWVEPETLLSMDWNPCNYATALDPDEFTYNEEAKTFIFDLAKEKLEYKLADRDKQYSMLANNEALSINSLTKDVLNIIKDPNTNYSDLLEFIRRCIEDLHENRQYDIGLLNRAKYTLATVIEQKLEKLKLIAREKGFASLLLAPTSNVEVSFNDGFPFIDGNYSETYAPYRGDFVFQKHFYSLPRDLKSNGEEFLCAQAIDSHPNVEFWVRNLVRQPESFRLPLSSGKWFYPDFILKLKDGRVMAIEYKGKPYITNDDSKEKNCVGELWESKSKGKALYLMAVKTDSAGRNIEQQLTAKLT